MSKGKQLMLMTACGVLSVSTAYAVPPGHGDEEVTSGDVTFSAKVEKQCGIDVTAASADLAFGDNYLDSTAQVKLINNEKDGKIEFRVEPIKTEDLGDQVTKNDVHFRAESSVSADMSAPDWEEGIEFSRDDLRSNNLVNLAARVSIDESSLDADDYELVTNWIIECD
ncbi:hypothetical protein F2Z80_21515 [Vibrio fortis]|uniref:Uncharacterized protein n=1 Tax=Vibrio fortis TaxID=212667 RepID=A0A5N3S4A1_9VIBR|nr:hypothetical protein [Vibrio fortis]KAB0301626.1 hypothetical protein F2Z80_21515 [Vibrio fortis]|tara:strand:+ start:77 stop:580 length:504 start_codon:yes stop_codon:yes gene_type:complete